MTVRDSTTGKEQFPLRLAHKDLATSWWPVRVRPYMKGDDSIADITGIIIETKLPTKWAQPDFETWKKEIFDALDEFDLAVSASSLVAEPLGKIPTNNIRKVLHFLLGARGGKGRELPGARQRRRNGRRALVTERRYGGDVEAEAADFRATIRYLRYTIGVGRDVSIQADRADFSLNLLVSEILPTAFEKITGRPCGHQEEGPCARFIKAVLKHTVYGEMKSAAIFSRRNRKRKTSHNST